MRADDDDAALETLLLPFIDGVLPWPSRRAAALFLRARDGWPLHQRALARPGVRAELQARGRCAGALRA